jgi:nucleoside-diphosphate-sugar epimerase
MSNKQLKILVLGANGFIGSHLCEAMLADESLVVYAMDLVKDKLDHCIQHERFHFFQGDMTIHQDWLNEHIQRCDVVLPLAAIATPATYVQNPLRIFELDFEANIKIIRQCVQYGKRIVFPSTSEVYGMCQDLEFDEETSQLVTGPIHKERWIYSTSKQLLDRVIYAYSRHHQLSYTLFRPFNWYGPRLDDVHNPKRGASRVLTQFIGNIIRGEDILLVNGGLQQRCFAYIDDCIAALLAIVKNEQGTASNTIFNIGNPTENISIRCLAELLIDLVQLFPLYQEKAAKTRLVEIAPEQYYGVGYEDVALRVPSIQRATQALNWKPTTPLVDGLKKTLGSYLAIEATN